MNPNNHLISDRLLTVSQTLEQKGYSSSEQDDILASLELQIAKLGGEAKLSQQEQFEIVMQLAPADSYPDVNSFAMEDEDEALVDEVSDYVQVTASAPEPAEPVEPSEPTVEAVREVPARSTFPWKKLVAPALALVAVLAIGKFYFSTQRDLVALEENVLATTAQVDNALQRRYDLIPNLVNAVKGYAKHEKELLTEITALRSQWAEQQDSQDKVRLEGELESSLSKLMVVSENYPELKADAMFQNLTVSLEGTENRISVERMRMINAVRVYNGMVRKAPQSWIAGLCGHSELKEQMQVSEEVRVAPKVEF